MSPVASWPIALATLRERGRAALLLGLLVVVITLGRSVVEGAAEGARGLSSFVLLLLAFFSGAGLISEELETGHAQLVLLRPVTRAAWFGGRLLGAGLVLACAVAAVGVSALVGGLFSRVAEGRLLAVLILPFALVDLAAWLTLLAALSVLARAWMNVAWVMLAALSWLAFRGAAAVLAPSYPIVERFVEAGQPYIHPHDSTPIARALLSGQPPDLEPLLWNLLWIAAFWAVGVLLLGRVELARRRT